MNKDRIRDIKAIIALAEGLKAELEEEEAAPSFPPLGEGVDLDIEAGRVVGWNNLHFLEFQKTPANRGGQNVIYTTRQDARLLLLAREIPAMMDYIEERAEMGSPGASVVLDRIRDMDAENCRRLAGEGAK